MEPQEVEIDGEVFCNLAASAERLGVSLHSVRAVRTKPEKYRFGVIPTVIINGRVHMRKEHIDDYLSDQVIATEKVWEH